MLLPVILNIYVLLVAVNSEFVYSNNNIMAIVLIHAN